MPDRTTELRLSSLPADTLADVEPWLWRHIPKDRVVLGGGTVLAARWGHRVSTDVDLFAEHGTLDAVNEAELQDEGQRRTSTFRLYPHAIELNTLAGGRLSLFCDANPPPRQPGEHAAGLAVMPTTAILSGKVYGRIVRNGTLVARDMYDLAVAACVDPDAMRVVFRSMLGNTMRDVASEMQQEPDGFRSQPIINPTYPLLDDNLLPLSRFLFHAGPEAFRTLYGDVVVVDVQPNSNDGGGQRR